jgi:hypothetical protein
LYASAIEGKPPVANIDKAGIQPVPSPIKLPRRAAPPAGFEEFWRAAYRRLLAAVLCIGATQDETHDAITAAMEEVLRRWGEISEPLAYARRAARTHFFKENTATSAHCPPYRAR